MSEHLVTEISRSLVPEQFEDRHQQKESSTLGMWTFLATEILFFGVLFASYTIYRHQWPDAFRRGSLDLKWYLGGLNTAVLLLSSFCMAMAVHAAALGNSGKIIRYLALTILIGGLFLAIKGTEYYIEFREHLVPGPNFRIDPPAEEQTGVVVGAFDKFEKWFHSSVLHDEDRYEHERHLPRPGNEELFMLFYFIMTAIHATHMIIGIGVMIVLIVMAKRGAFSAKYHNPVEMFGLYWHFVDIVWVFLFPALYLLRQP
ncbi:MAG TPA: cytochrome c oxidase subunit 3 family protein [Tepidisphaeraceae bacterium]|jgi:cytochrome c oxidase subunit 3|nr:cytochrome c oxidase subunit 3 family protein [Tepidisphaeraceae bacterium]